MNIEKKHLSLRSFVSRQRGFTKAQERVLKEGWTVYGLEFSSKPLNFYEIFSRDANRILEIGFGNGESLLAQALASPETDFIGIEVYRPGIVSLLKEALAKGVKNLRVLQADAVQLFRHALCDESLMGVQIFFPDPWPKKRHRKRRLFQPQFFHFVFRTLKVGGRVHCATDCEDYAQTMLKILSENDRMLNLAREGRYYPTPYLLRPETKFERRGRRLGNVVNDIVFEKVK